jgi:hypothetical protein
MMIQGRRRHAARFACLACVAFAGLATAGCSSLIGVPDVPAPDGGQDASTATADAGGSSDATLPDASSGPDAQDTEATAAPDSATSSTADTGPG